MSGDHATSSISTSFDAVAFLRAASHEIANPLNAISMNAGLAKMLLERSQIARATEVLDRLLAECGRCASILREMQRFGSSLNTQARETIEVQAVIDDAMAEFAQRYSGVSPSMNIDGGAHSIVAARLALTRAICGLLLNAAEAGAANIAIRARTRGNSVEITIDDDGPGIPPEILPRVTEPFFTTQRSSGHNGLGLTLASIVLRAHGGHLQMEANSDGGARLVLHLPDPTEIELAGVMQNPTQP